MMASVTDEGDGMPPHELDRIFERFYRVDPARSRATGGTGLGLAIVKHVCAHHRGDVHVSSILRQGSTFTISLPAADPADLSAVLGRTASGQRGHFEEIR